MTEEEFKKETAKGINSLANIAAMAKMTTNNYTIRSAGDEYVKQISGAAIAFIETLQKEGVDIG